MLEHARRGARPAPTYPDGEVATERDRLADRIQVAREPAAHLARVALRASGCTATTRTPCRRPSRRAGRGGHAPAQLRALHADRGAAGRRDAGARRRHRPGAALDAAEAALGGWTGAAPARDLPPTPPLAPGAAAAGRPARLGAVVAAAGRCRRCRAPHPDHAALQLANLVFGGYFSSRWVENIREDKGYTYGPHSGDRALGRRLARARSSSRGGHRGDRARRCWRRGTSWAGWPRCRRRDDELERPGSTRSARVLMQEYAIYSVIPPEGCAAILWRDAGEESRSGRGAQDYRARPAEGRDHRRDHARADRRRAHGSRRGRAARGRACSQRALAEVERDGLRGPARRAGTTSSGTWAGSGSNSWMGEADTQLGSLFMKQARGTA